MTREVEYVIVYHPMGSLSGEPMSQIPVEMEKGPEKLMMAAINNAGLDITRLLTDLGFQVEENGDTQSGLLPMNTPEIILDKPWGISYQESGETDKDPNLFTIYLKHEQGIGYLHFLRQIKNQKGEYCISFI